MTRDDLSQDAEQSVLGAMLMDPDAAEVATEVLGADDFADPRHALLFAGMVALAASGVTVDPLTLAASLEQRQELKIAGGKELIAYLIDAVPTSANVRHHAVLVRRYADERRGDRTAEAHAEAAAQVDDGLADIVYRDPATMLRWPWPALDGPIGGMAPGQVHFVCAFSGIGKTTFVLSAIDCWARDGVRVDVLPLEAKASEFRVRWACFRADQDPRPLIKGQWALDDPRREIVAQEYRRQRVSPLADLVCVSGKQRINLATLRESCERAAERGSRVVIVDHIDHMTADEKRSAYQGSLEVTQGAHDIAKATNMVLLMTSQLNSEAVSGGDRLSKYQPPTEGMVKFGQHKREVSTTMIGLFRPLRPRGKDEPKTEKRADDRYLRALTAARSGEADAQTVLEAGVQGVTVMKDRNGTDGGIVRLGYERGKVIALPPPMPFSLSRGGAA